MEGPECSAASVNLVPEVFEYFARRLMPMQREIRECAADPTHSLHLPLLNQLTAIDSEAIAHTVARGDFQRRVRAIEVRDLDREARIWTLAEALAWEVPRRRIAMLEPPTGELLPVPLRHPALEGITPTIDGLVPLNEFQWDGSRLVRNGFAFLPFSPVEAPNSQYWFLQELFKLGRSVCAHVRLDPLMYGTAREMPSMFYKMLVYGQPLNWARLRNLKKEEHGKWTPGKSMRGVEVTDFAWSPRGGEVHFRCEEIPRRDSSSARGSRYFHAVYVPARDEFVHLDAAIRVFTMAEWRQRMEIGHVRKAGKIGRRYKVFRIDTPLSTDAFSDLCAQFFVWNSDVHRYFGADIPEDL